jgi:acyl-CoA dehydrogenase
MQGEEPGLSEDGMIAEAARRIFADLADPQAQTRAAPGAWAGRLWPALSEAGLTAAWAPEALGGAGAETADGFAILRVAAQYAAPAPVAESLLAARLLTASGLAVPEGALTAPAGRPGDALRLDPEGRVTGRLRAVPFGASADRLAALAEGPDGAPQAVLLDLAQARARPRATDTGSERADLAFEAAPALAAAPAGLEAEAVETLGAVIRAAQIAGALETVLHLASDYAQQRVAFGRPIGRFQAVQQNLARLAEETAAALAASASAADALATEGVAGADLFLEAAAAKIRAGEAADEGAKIAHQVHGAIGFTEEHQLHLYTRQLWAWRDDFGAESRWALRLGARICAAGPDALWPALARR